jgi:hypothetical protein
VFERSELDCKVNGSVGREHWPGDSGETPRATGFGVLPDREQRAATLNDAPIGEHRAQ